jgi:2-phosphosulfolactate phosphatase
MTPHLHVLEGLAGASAATGHVVVVDVMRAFTTAAYAFAAGIEEIELVATPEEAFARRGWRMGEVGGRLIPGFDHNNSPSQLLGRRLSGRAVMRTGAGTRCAVAAAPRAASLWLASLVVVSATARAIRGLDPVTLVVSGAPDEGEEDRACADVLTALLLGRSPDWPAAERAVRASRAAAHHATGDPDRPPEDVDCAVAMDRFGFAMNVAGLPARLIARRMSGDGPRK